MIGAIDQLEGWALMTDEPPDERRGRYYCGCGYVPSETHCPAHGDPCERYPTKRREEQCSDQ